MEIYIFIVVLIPFTLIFTVYPKLLKKIEESFKEDIKNIKQDIQDKKPKGYLIANIITVILQSLLYFSICFCIVAAAALFIMLSTGYAVDFIQSGS